MSNASCYLGCPLWAHAPWKGTFFTRDARREEFLPQYASVFGTAEGNATFYGLPAPDTVARWAQEAPEGFRFCFKFPRVISHDRQLVDAEADTVAFFERLAPLGTKLGPFFLQLHQSFGPERLPWLDMYLCGLPSTFAYAVEVRHVGFFDGGPGEAALDALLAERGVDRVLFDTRGLFASTAKDELTIDAKRKKPRVPFRRTATGRRPFVRFVGDPEVEKNDAVLRDWAAIAAAWIREGRTPYVFLHHPDDAHAPALARRFQRWLHEATPAVPVPPPWPVEQEATLGGRNAQLELF